MPTIQLLAQNYAYHPVACTELCLPSSCLHRIMPTIQLLAQNYAYHPVACTELCLPSSCLHRIMPTIQLLAQNYAYHPVACTELCLPSSCLHRITECLSMRHLILLRTQLAFVRWPDITELTSGAIPISILNRMEAQNQAKPVLMAMSSPILKSAEDWEDKHTNKEHYTMCIHCTCSMKDVYTHVYVQLQDFSVLFRIRLSSRVTRSGPELRRKPSRGTNVNPFTPQHLQPRARKDDE